MVAGAAPAGAASSSCARRSCRADSEVAAGADAATPAVAVATLAARGRRAWTMPLSVRSTAAVATADWGGIEAAGAVSPAGRAEPVAAKGNCLSSREPSSE